jgi:2'-5' RNA ligase
VPDEGHSQLIDLHDRLYTGLLSLELRLDIPYTPHITIAMNDSAQHCQSLADSLNAREIAIHGTIDALQVVGFESHVITPIERIELST